jgi:anion-transporting  ArsA/GET3 family ATPase
MDGPGIDRLLERKEVCICGGSGGVGKTTASAGIAAGMAARGRKVAVLTIDPARRLADSLGLPELGNEERLVDPRRFEAAGIEMKGELWAMMLDAKRTFDEVVESHAPDEQTRDAVLGNRIYQELSNAVAGSQEYMAMEKLHELHEEGRYDLLVLDTPPSRHALDFLDAPRRLSRFIDSRSLQLFTAPGRLGLRVLGRGTGVLFSVLGRATGVDVLEDLSEFFRSFGGMVEGFRERAERVNALLADGRSTFVVVTSPTPEAVEEAIFFHHRLRDSGLPFGGAIVNRVHEVADGAGAGAPESEVRELVGDPLAGKVLRTLEDYRRLAERDRRGVERLRERLERKPLLCVPHFDDDVHDIAGLVHMNRYLFGDSPAGAE